MSQLAPGSQSITEERVEERHEEGDEERFSHYVPKAKLTEAQVMGTPVIALCGKVWVPTRNPERFPRLPDVQGDLGIAAVGQGGGARIADPVSRPDPARGLRV